MALPETAPLEVPVGAESLAVSISWVRIEGEFPELAEAAAALTREVAGKHVTVAQLYAYAFAVEQAYASAGYVLARVVVPPQKLVDGGTFKLVIVDGYIEDVDVATLSPHVRQVVADRMAPIVGRRHIKLADIERNVLLAGEVPGLRLRSTLARGRDQGGTRLILEGVHRVAQGGVSVNNSLDSSYGRWQYAASAATNSALGFGEQIYGTYSGSDDLESTFDGTTPLRIVGAGAVFPLGNDGLTVNPEYTNSRAHPIIDPGSLATEDVFERFAVRVAYPFLLTRSRMLRGQFAYEHIEQTSEALDFGVDISRDSYGVLRAGLEFGGVTPQGGAPVSLSATFSQGLSGRDQADADASGVPLSRQGAGPDFQKLVAEARYIEPLPNAVRLDLIVRGQSSFHEALLESEQFTLDGSDIVSGFESGTFSVDEGVAARAELSRPWALPQGAWASVITPYVFGAAGRGWLVEPTAVERETVGAASAGVGVRANVEGPDGLPGGSINFELARRFSDDPDASEGYRGNFSASVRF